MNEYDRNFSGGRHRRARRAGPGRENDGDVARQKLAGRRLQRGAIAFNVASFKKKILSLLITETFESFAEAFDSLCLGTFHLLDQYPHASRRLRQRKNRSAKDEHQGGESQAHVRSAITIRSDFFGFKRMMVHVNRIAPLEKVDDHPFMGDHGRTKKSL